MGYADLGNVLDRIVSIVRTSGTGAAGTIDTYTITTTSGATYTFNVTNGANGVSGSPNGVYATLALLEAAYPTGDSHVYIVSADNHWYFWDSDNSAWTDGGPYLVDSDYDYVMNILNQLMVFNTMTVTGSTTQNIKMQIKNGDTIVIKNEGSSNVNVWLRDLSTETNLVELGQVNAGTTREWTSEYDCGAIRVYFVGATTVTAFIKERIIPQLEADVSSLKETQAQFNEALDVNHNMIDESKIIEGKLWSYSTWQLSNNANANAYPLIRVEANKTYYFRNLYAYFCILKYDDNTNERVESSNSQDLVSGSVTPTKNGYIGISVSSAFPNAKHLFTDSQKMYNLAIFEDVFFPKMLKNNLFDFYVGSTRQYTTLRSAVEEAIKYPNSRVFVDPETFDLCQEFSAEITAQKTSQYGIPLGNGIHIIFASGSKVTALHAGNNAYVEQYFAPFYAVPDMDGGFTLENLDISVSNTRYCVHDEYAGADKIVRNKYINCRMEMDNTAANLGYYPECIGGGCAKNTYVEIRNCWFKTKKAENNVYDAVSYHNANNNNAQSNIFVSDCYFADKSTFRLGYYGNSTKISKAYLNNCSLGATPIVGHEVNEATTPENFELISWNNEIRQ